MLHWTWWVKIVVGLTLYIFSYVIEWWLRRRKS